MHQRKDGSVYPVEVSATGASIDGQNVVITVCRDITQRKQAELALRDSEERFHNLFDNMAEGVALHELLLDAEGLPAEYRILEVNAAFASILGIDSAKVVGQLSRAAYGIEAPPYLSEYAAVVANQQSIMFEAWFAPLRKHFSISVVPWRSNGFATIFSDISQRKQAELALRDSEERLSTLFQQAADGITLIDAESMAFVEFNDAACASLGYSRDEFAQLDLAQLNAEYSARQIRAAIDDILESGAADFETLHRHKDGSLRNIWVSNRLVRIQGRTYIAAMWTDITHRKAAEQALREAEMRWKFALEGSGLGVWDWNIESGETYFSPLWLEMIGYAADELTAISRLLMA
jgi:PAS domain S-box-containing protein